MKLHSLACRTDLIFPRFDGEITDRGEYLVVKTPDNPSYFFGNFLLFFQAPEKGDFARWSGLFEKEFQANPLVQHKTFVWDTVGENYGDPQPFVENDYTFEKSVVLTATSVRKTCKFWPELEIRQIRTDHEWAEIIENQIQTRQGRYELEAYRPFKTKQMQRYRRMTEAGLGFWFGAYAQGKMAAYLGVFFDGKLGHFQSVGTHPDFRRKGACGTLVYETSQFVFKNCGIEKLVMVADADYHAARIYESVGFLPTEKQCGAFWYRRSKQAENRR